MGDLEEVLEQNLDTEEKVKRHHLRDFLKTFNSFWHKVCSYNCFLNEFQKCSLKTCLTQLGYVAIHQISLWGATLDSFLPSSFHSKPFFAETINTVENRVWNPEKLKTKTNLYQVAAFGRVWEDIQLVPKMVTKAQAGTLELPPEGEDKPRTQK